MFKGNYLINTSRERCRCDSCELTSRLTWRSFPIILLLSVFFFVSFESKNVKGQSTKNIHIRKRIPARETGLLGKAGWRERVSLLYYLKPTWIVSSALQVLLYFVGENRSRSNYGDKTEKLPQVTAFFFSSDFVFSYRNWHGIKIYLPDQVVLMKEIKSQEMTVIDCVFTQATISLFATYGK